ncbi:molybdenum cofactor guanylyltransferase MobA [Exilibacterium tricleocarpae]|uniref:molybdenum cofactor guanylyltransferase MobA n=1 Tax=Exilibacterium tricleocarpae TaxID=2591008 RepID=UPI0015D168B5|nr:molybdenum cofactor guanylyltransferase MobA [Exilibacterium tricleocarpae]
MHSSRSPAPVTGLVLAGGRSRRMAGADKTFIRLNGTPLIEHVIDRAAPQVTRLLLSINGDAAPYRRYGLPLLADALPGFGGPLAGILSALRWLRQHQPDSNWLASFAVDTPFIPADTVARLQAATERDHTLIACPRSGGRQHPVCGLWSPALLPELEDFLLVQKQHKVGRFLQQCAVSRVDFEAAGIDPFFNINTPQDLETATAYTETQ